MWYVRPAKACADPGIFVRGGGSRSVWQKKKADVFFFFFFFFVFFLVLSLFYRSQMVNFKEIYLFFKVPEGVQHFPGGGSNIFQGVQLLIPYRNPYKLWFSRGGGPDPLSPPLDPHLIGSDQSAHMRSLIRAFASRLNILWAFATDWISFGVSKLKRLVWAYTCQNATSLEITCHSSYMGRFVRFGDFITLLGN